MSRKGEFPSDLRPWGGGQPKAGSRVLIQSGAKPTFGPDPCTDTVTIKTAWTTFEDGTAWTVAGTRSKETRTTIP
jgi:hypothetical protein